MIFEGAFITPELQTILDFAGGVLLYQEQVMQVMQQYSDFDDETADTARSAMGKKLADKMKTLKKKFVEGAVAKGHPEKDALIIWQDLEKYSEYSFNRCLPGFQFLLTDKGPKNIDMIREMRKRGNNLLLLNSEKSFVRIEAIEEAGEKEIYEVTFQNGEKFYSTLEHKFSTQTQRGKRYVTLKTILKKNYKILAIV